MLHVVVGFIAGTDSFFYFADEHTAMKAQGNIIVKQYYIFGSLQQVFRNPHVIISDSYNGFACSFLSFFSKSGK